MYAIVDIAGQQFKVEKNQKVFVHRLEDKEGSKVTFDKVLLVENGDKITVGEPLVKGATVSAKVVGHLKGDKVIVFKKKRRKGYQKSNGHRQYLTELLIDGISTTAKKAPAAKKEADPAEAKAEAPAKKPAAKKEDAPKAEAKKAPAAKKAAPKKEAAKKEEPKKED